MAVNIFDDDHGVVNNQADGNCQTSERHQIQRAAEKFTKKKVPITESGRDVAATRVVRTSRRNQK